MRIGINGKAEQQILDLMDKSGIDSPTHLLNLLVNYITTQHRQEAIIYAQARNYNKNQKEA